MSQILSRECQSVKKMWRSKRENSCATLLNEETTRVGPWENRDISSHIALR
jgi:hypothetical protein